MSPNRNSIEERVRGLNGTYYLRREVAAALECSVGLLVKVRNEDPAKCGSTFAIEWRGSVVYLYTLDDVRRLQAHFADRWPHLAVDPSPGVSAAAGSSLAWSGQPRLFDDDERRERQRRHTQAGYWKSRAACYARRGLPDLAEQASARCEQIRQQLRAERAKRLAPNTVPVEIDLVVW